MTQQYTGFFVNTGTIQVELSDEQSVEIKAEMSIGDWERYEGSMLQIVAENEVAQNGNRAIRRRQQKEAASNKTQVKMSAGLLELLEINIVSWTFADVPVNRSNISKLRNEHANKILDAIQGQNPDNPLDPNQSYSAETST